MSHEPSDDPSSAFQAIAVVVVILFVTVLILGSLMGGLATSLQQSLVDTSGDTIDADVADESVTLVDSTGFGLYHGHGLSSVDADTDGNVGDANSTVSVWAALDDDAAANDDFHVANVGDGVVSIQLRGDEWYGYYNDTVGGVAEVSGSATDPTELTQVAVVANGTHLALIEDGDEISAEPFDGGSDASVPTARSWWGDQDELRVWDAPLGDEDLQTLHDDPIMSVAHDDLEARLMMDEGEGSTTHVLVHDSDASLTGDVDWTSGLDGTELLEGTDWTRDDGTIHIIDGSRLDQLQVAYLTVGGSVNEMLDDVADTTGPALLLAGVVPILLIAAWMLRSMRSFGNNGGRI